MKERVPYVVTTAPTANGTLRGKPRRPEELLFPPAGIQPLELDTRSTPRDRGYIVGHIVRGLGEVDLRRRALSA
jgi:hypothetical protein